MTTTDQDRTLHALLRVHDSLEVRPCVAGQLLVRCLDAQRRTTQTLYVYRDGSTSSHVRPIAAAVDADAGYLGSWEHNSGHGPHYGRF